jgi:hypothetical protein
MEKVTRRGLVAGMAAVVASRAVGQAAQASSAEPHAEAGDFAGGSKVFAVSAMTPTKLPNGSERIGVFDGTLATGEKLSMHESWAPAGMAPAPVHRITHSEVVVVLEGEVEFVHDGRTDTAKHAMRNVGPVTARYVVLQMGGDTK